jgi:hypothetical protein
MNRHDAKNKPHFLNLGVTAVKISAVLAGPRQIRKIDFYFQFTDK